MEITLCHYALKNITTPVLVSVTYYVYWIDIRLIQIHNFHYVLTPFDHLFFVENDDRLLAPYSGRTRILLFQVLPEPTPRLIRPCSEGNYFPPQVLRGLATTILAWKKIGNFSLKLYLSFIIYFKIDFVITWIQGYLKKIIWRENLLSFRYIYSAYVNHKFIFHGRLWRLCVSLLIGNRMCALH